MKVLVPRGGDFLLAGTRRPDIFSPEDFSSEQRQMAKTAQGVVEREILPAFERIETQDFKLVREKMRLCGELGLFLVDIPEEYGGLELEKSTSMLLTEKMASSGSFSITFSGQTGIGSLPLVYYGTAAQKQKYLGKLASGEWIGAYCLTEPECGSDPLAARTTATPTTDGRHYVLNGIKQFITNAAFADIFTVFAKINGTRFSAFLVERDSEGLSIGAEEKKMGLKGSSTAQVVLQNVRVPTENLLGEPGRGHKIAFNVLNMGRLKIAASATGMAKAAFSDAAVYAEERKQFKQPIGDFGAIREKLADMAAAIFVSESVVYRIAGLLDARIALLDRSAPDYLEHQREAVEEYAAECAISKVFCTDMLAAVVDEALQIHGGYGYMSDYPVERYYRDERINRIFEGTNEINRVLIPTLLFRRAEDGRLDLWSRADGAGEDFETEAERESAGRDLFNSDFFMLANLKRLFLMILGSGSPLEEPQEVLLALADMIIAIFALESAILRAGKIYPSKKGRMQELLRAVVTVSAFEQASCFHRAASRCCAYRREGTQPRLSPSEIAHLTAYPGAGLLKAKQILARNSRESRGYFF